MHTAKFNVFTFSQAQNSLMGGLIRAFHLLVAYYLQDLTFENYNSFCRRSVDYLGYGLTTLIKALKRRKEILNNKKIKRVFFQSSFLSVDCTQVPEFVYGEWKLFCSVVVIRFGDYSNANDPLFDSHVFEFWLDIGHYFLKVEMEL